ncbi:MAG: flagellar hook-length control protein FliK [Hyphomonadaceae bacterium]
MDFAADAVMDAIAPPPRPAARAAAAADDGPSFDDHLATAERADSDAPGETPLADSADKPLCAKAHPAHQDAAENELAPEGDDEPLPPAPIALLQPQHPAAAPLTIQLAAAPPVEASPEAELPLEAALDTAAPGVPASPRAAPATADTAGERADADDGQSRDDAMASKSKTPQTAKTVTTDVSDLPQTHALSLPVAPAGQQTETAPQMPPPAPAEVEATAIAQATPKATAAVPRFETGATPPAPEAEPEPGAADSLRSQEQQRVQPQAKQAAAKSVQAFSAALSDAMQQSPPEPHQPAPQVGNGDGLTVQSAAQPSTHVRQAEQTSSHAPAPVVAQVGQEIIRRFNGGGSRFELRLDPPELGRVEVRLDVSRDHRVTAVIAADSPQALSELARHSRELEQTLQSAGLQLSENGLSFDLRQGQRGDANQSDSERSGAATAPDAAPETPAAAARPLGFERWRGVRVDLMV